MNKIFNLNNSQGILNIILIISIFVLFYIIINQKNTIEKMTNVDTTDNIHQAVKDVYNVDVAAIRNLSNLAGDLVDKDGGLTVPGNLTVNGNINTVGDDTYIQAGESAKMTTKKDGNDSVACFTYDGLDYGFHILRKDKTKPIDSNNSISKIVSDFYGPKTGTFGNARIGGTGYAMFGHKNVVGDCTDNKKGTFLGKDTGKAILNIPYPNKEDYIDISANTSSKWPTVAKILKNGDIEINGKKVVKKDDNINLTGFSTKQAINHLSGLDASTDYDYVYRSSQNLKISNVS